MNEDNGPPGDESAESCPELDDNYFQDLGNMVVVDSWSESNKDGGQVIKKEPSPRKPSTSRHRRESDRSENSRDARNGDRNDKRSRSPRRSPPRRHRSPINKRRIVRRNSPPPPRRNNQGKNNRPSFLEEITQKIPALRQDMANQNAFNNQVQPIYGYGMNPMMPNHMMMQGQPMMQGAPYNGQYQMMDPYMQQQSMMMNAMPFNPAMGQIGAPTMIEPPLPVPPPVISIGATHNQMAPPAPTSDQLRKVPNTGGVDIAQAKKKAFEAGRISMTDYLRQVSQQTSKNAAAADINSKREKGLKIVSNICWMGARDLMSFFIRAISMKKINDFISQRSQYLMELEACSCSISMHERCKEAAKLLDELTTRQTRLPFVLNISNTRLPTMKSDPKLGSKSPLTMSDNNMTFLMQAGVCNTRDALQANPLRNISGPLFNFARNLGLDLAEISQNVQRHVEIENEKELLKLDNQEISSNAVNVALKKADRSCQTDANPCQKCEKRDKRKFKAAAAQTETVDEPEEEPGSFNAKISAKMMRKLTKDQQMMLVQFCHKFDIQDSRFLSENASRYDDDIHLEDDRLSYTNPENPQLADPNFISFSPPRNVSRAISRSPIRHRPAITSRLGQKIPSPLYDGSGHSRSYSRPVTSYHIPSPEPRRRSPFSPNGYRNRSHSMSPRLRDRTRSPEERFSSRHGRY